MREFCTSGSVGTSGRKRPGVTRQSALPKLQLYVQQQSSNDVDANSQAIERSSSVTATHGYKLTFTDSQRVMRAAAQGRTELSHEPTPEAGVPVMQPPSSVDLDSPRIPRLDVQVEERDIQSRAEIRARGLRIPGRR
jgi:hypothetical protein